MNILGISCHYHEAAAALLTDGKIVAAAAEERFTRKKHDPSFPDRAIDFCLAQAKLSAKDTDYVAFYEKPLIKFERTLTVSMTEFPRGLGFFVEGMKNAFAEKLWIQSAIINKLDIPAQRIFFVPQHLSHAAAAYYPSPFRKSAYVTLDAVGEWTTGSWGVGNGIKLTPKAELRFPHSVGLLYSTFTAYLGFEVNDGEFKVMGMAAYGRPKYADRIKKLYRQFPDGSIELNLRYFAFHHSNKRMYTKDFEDLFAGCDRYDLGASIQKCTEEIILRMMRYVHTQTHEDNLVFGGGVALNSVVNGLVTRETPFKHLFIFPAAGDDGGSAGAALYAYHHVLENVNRCPLTHVFFGPHYTNDTIRQYLENTHLRYRRMSDTILIDFIANQLAHGKIVGWFEGRSEFGPRALGHRSILADPRTKEMKDIVNARIKFREEFRPFAPVVLSRFAKKYFDVTEDALSPYMVGTFNALPIARKQAPAVVHEDGTSRIQTVDKKKYPGRYARLLESFYKKTRVPVLLNTSFNLKGEPIVETPHDAISTFVRSGLDILVLENFILSK